MLLSDYERRNLGQSTYIIAATAADCCCCCCCCCSTEGWRESQEGAFHLFWCVDGGGESKAGRKRNSRIADAVGYVIRSLQSNRLYAGKRCKQLFPDNRLVYRPPAGLGACKHRFNLPSARFVSYTQTFFLFLPTASINTRKGGYFSACIAPRETPVRSNPVAVGVSTSQMSNPPPPNVAQPQTNERASFQAPTRASLARAHPTLLERALSRSPVRSPPKPTKADARAVGLRDRKALRPSLTSSGSPLKPPKKAKPSPRLSGGLNVFAAPPKRVSTRITASDLAFGSPASTQRSIEEPRHINTPDDQLTSELGSVTGDLDVTGDLSQPSLQEILEEPDLPPTPTQLGLEPPPGRSKGLLSSSPSSQQAKWGRRRTTDNPEQTPSRLRSVNYGEADDMTESGPTMDWESFPEHILKKRKLRNELSDEMEQLKKEIAELEDWSKELSQKDEHTERDLSKLMYAPPDNGCKTITDRF